jgi:DNA-binding GntR family transcriptional regulator
LPGIVQYSREDHQEIYCLLKNGEYDKAKDLLRIHIRKFVDLGVVKWGEQTLDFNPGDSHTT